MEQDYLDNLHGILKDIYGDEFSLDIDSFKSKMVNEAPYRDNVYGIMQDEYGSEFTLDPKTFYNKVLESSKKKSQSEIGSQTTQPGGGSENAQYAFEPGFQGEKPFFQTLRPEDQQVQEEQQVSEKPKRVIYRGEGTREALETQFAPEVKKEARKATVVEATKPIAKEMGEVIKPTSKIQKLADLNYMNQNPDDFNATYYDVFKDEAEKSGDPEKYSKDLKDKYANDFIDEEFKEEFNIANELKYIEDKMKREISSLQSNPNAKTPQGQEYIKNKINEYTQLIKSKTAKLDEVRKANNQKYQQGIDEIDNLFKTGESFMREDILNAKKNELMRKMKLIKLAENPEGLKQEVGEQEYNKIPGSTADEKLNNYLNTRLTIYDQFKEDALDAAFDRSRFYGEKKDRADQVYNSYMNLKGELKDLYYLAALKRYANPEGRSSFLEAAGEGFLGKFAEGAFNFDDVGKKHSENLQKIAQEAGIQYSDKDKSFIEYTSAPAEPWSGEWWGDMTGTSSAFMAELALTRKPTSAVLKAAGSALKAAPQVTKIAQAGLSRYDKLGKTGQKFVNTVFNAAEEGAYFEGANQILHDGESSELTFFTGLSGGLLAAPVNALLKKAGGVVFNSFKKGAAQEITKDALTAERAAVLESLGAQKDEVKTLLSQFVKPTAGKDAVYMISGTFGKQSPKVIDLLEKVGTHLIARPTGEVAQEFGEELASIYQETSNFEEFKKEFSARFPDADAATQFVVASYMMGVGFGGGNFIGDVFTKKSKQGYDALTPEQKKVADKAIAEADAEIKNKEAEVLNEQEMNTPAKEKSKEETDWDNTRVEIEGKISQSGNQISALENIKQKIYEKYGITDPKTQDISGLSNEDAIKIETINSEIQREKKVKSKEEINLSIHEDNKPVIEETEESPMAVHADELIDKNKQDAVQERSTEEVLPREQGETTETGGEPQGMGQGVQGEEVAQEGQKVSQEDVEAKKADIEKRMQEELDSESGRIVESTEIWKDGEGRLYRIDKLKNGKQRLAATNEEGKLLNVIDTYEGSVSPTLFITDGQKVKDQEVRENKIADKINAKYHAELAALESGQQATKEGVEQQKAPEVQPTEELVNPLKDVESTAKALDKKINVKKSSIAVRLRKLAGIIAHSGENVISKFDFSKIKGGLRGRYGKGIYFSSLFKNYDYGDKSTYLDISKLNLMNGNMTVSEALNTLSLPSKIKRDIDILKNSLSKVKNNKDYDEISSEIKNLESIYSKFDQNSNYIERTLQKEADKNPSEKLDSILENLEARVNESNNLDTSKAIKGLEDSLNNMLIQSGFDGINFDEGREILIIPQEKINDYIVQSQDKFISEAYHKAKADGSNPELVNAVEELLGKNIPTEQVAEQPTPQVQEEKEPTTEEQTKMEDEAAKSEAMTPKNMKDLIGIYRKVFNLPYSKALVSAMVSNRLIKQMAKRAGVTPEQMYQKLKFQKATEDELKKLSKKGKLLKQIVGENAKLSQDIKNNLQVARDMEAAGKTPKEIRISTGWEKGVDGKWRYEIIDPSLNVSSFEELNDLLNTGQKTMGGFINIPLSKLMNNLQFGDDYRNKLSNVSVLFDNSVPIGQAYYQNGAIHINPYSAKYNENYSTEGAFDNFKSIILHEVQHHIQQNEGFAMPFSEEGYKFEINYEIENAQAELDQAIRISEWEPSYKDRIKPLKDKLESLKDKKKNISEEDLDKMYWLSSGEVEARNVQARMNMTDEQRRQTTLAETEDVARDEQIVLFQKDAEKARGAMMITNDGQAIIYALTDANVSTPLHELAHVFEHYLTDAEKNKIIKAAKTKGWTTETSEYFARGFEKYLAEGKSSDPIFEKFKQFLLDIYKAIKGSPIDVKLNKQMKDIYAQMLGEDLTAELGEDIEEQETKLDEMEVSEANLVSEYEQIKNMSGIDKIDAMNKWKEKYGELANRYMYIENNYDKLAEQFKAIRTCEFE
jgi:hypothetical protein